MQVNVQEGRGRRVVVRSESVSESVGIHFRNASHVGRGIS